MEIKRLAIPGAMLLTPRRHKDGRGWFSETYKASAYGQAGLPAFVQDNLSYSRRGVLRGLHYQVGASAQAKLVQVMAGRILDVIVDLESHAVYTVELSGESGQQLFVPATCAHGFQVLSDDALVSYKVDREYDPGAERGIAWDDPTLDIRWPITPPVLSDKDAAH